MRTAIIIVLCVLVFIQLKQSFAQDKTVQNEFDFIQQISKSPDLVEKIGMRKLTVLEKSNLNSLLNQIYNLGLEEGIKQATALLVPSKSPTESESATALQASTITVYESDVESEEDEIIKLDNGAIIEITDSSIGYIGYNKDCILFELGSQWKIWIEDEGTYDCSLLKASAYGRTKEAELKYLSEVAGEGTILKMLDGSVYEVNSVDAVTTSIWLGASEVLIIDNYKLINLDEEDEMIEVQQLH